MLPLKNITPAFSVTGQVRPEDIGTLVAQGFKVVINNRPDREEPGQALSSEIAAEAKLHKVAYFHIPVATGQMTPQNIASFAEVLGTMPGPVLAFCRSGTRSATMWALANATSMPIDDILKATAAAGYDLAALRPELDSRRPAPAKGKVVPMARSFDVVIVGGGAAGCAAAASLLKRRPRTGIAIIEPSEQHYYQPAWTLVGGGAFDVARTSRPTQDVLPRGVEWIRASAAAFEPEQNRVLLSDGSAVGYRYLIVCPGLKLDWEAVEGLVPALGRNGVTSNYLFDLAPYTWQLVQNLKGGTALFTQPPMPIKCAGAPQKAVYLSCHHWQRQEALAGIRVEFDNANGALFGVKEFVPPLMQYIERYGVALTLNSNLKAVDGPGRRAWFEVKRADGKVERVEKSFDMLHVVPPQCAPDAVRSSPLAGNGGWLDVDQETLRHARYPNVFGLGDVCGTANAKTAAAVRRQAPIVAENLICEMDGRVPHAVYDGYGACPLTVERGKVILAEFGYGGKLLPTFPLDPTKPRRSAWLLKAHILPPVYWDLMLRGKEWLAKPRLRPQGFAQEQKAA